MQESLLEDSEESKVRTDDKLSFFTIGIVFVGLLATIGMIMALVIAVAEVVERILRGLGI